MIRLLSSALNWSRSFTPLAIAAVSVLAVLVSAESALAGSPSTRLVTAPLVSPADAWTFYGSDQTHTAGVAALAASPPEIKALARTLGADRIGAGPGQMSAEAFQQNVYDYVRNNIATEYRFGLGKGGRGALIDLSGTPFDQAELMKKLLAEGGIASSYKVGVVTMTPQEFGAWSGMAKNINQSAQTFDVDALAACQFLADGGIPAIVNGVSSCTGLTGNLTSLSFSHIWLQVGSLVYDPSFKKHILKTGIDVPAAMGCGTASAPTCGATMTTATLTGATQGTLSGASIVTNLNQAAGDSQLATFATSLQTTIEAADENASIEDVVGGKTVDVTYQPVAASALPYVGGGTVQGTWSGDVPDQYRTTFRFQFRSLDVSLFVDEMSGRKLNSNIQIDFAGAVLTLSMDLSPPDGIYFGYDNFTDQPGEFFITTTINHPYAAQTGTFADEVTDFPVVGGVTAVVVSVGKAGPSKARYAADIDQVLPEDVTMQVGGKAPTAAQFSVQLDQGSKLIEGVTDTAITQHHIVGLSGLFLNLSTSVSVNSQTSDATLRGSAFRTFTLLGGMLEGSVPQQAQDAWVARSFVSLVPFSNDGGATFADVNPTNFSAISSSLQYPAAEYQPYIDAGQSILTRLAQSQQTMTLVNGTAVRPVSAYMTYDAASEAYWGERFQKGGSADPNAVDPTRTVNDSIKQSPVALKSAFSADLLSGNVTLAPPPDLVTGAGAFPFSLSLQRTYSSGNSYYEGSGVSSPGAYRERYAGADASVLGRFGGGWQHNFQIVARLNNDGLTGLGADRAADAASAIAALTVIADQNKSPTFTGRLSSIMAGAWLGQQFIGNTVNVSLPPSSLSFVKRANGQYAAPAGSADRLTQTGAKVGPVGVSVDGGFNYLNTFAYDYGAITLNLTRSAGETVSFSPGRWKYQFGGLPTYSGVGNLHRIYDPLFYATQLAYPDGMKVDLTYETISIFPYDPVTHYDPGERNGWQLKKVSNSLGRELNFTTVESRITSIEDENGRTVNYGYDCGAYNWLSCDAFTVTTAAGTADAAISRYEYAADGASPDPEVFNRSNYRLRRWFTPTNTSTPFLTFAYDDVLRLKTVTDPLSRQARYYPGAVAGTENWKRGELIDALNARTVAIFDRKGRQTAATDPLGRTTTFAYDTAGRQVLKVMPEGDSKTTTYDVRSNPLTVTSKAKPGSGLADLVATTTYLEGPTVRVCVNPVVCNLPASQDGPRTDVTDVFNYSWNTTTGQLTQVLSPADAVGQRPQVDLTYSNHTIGSATLSLLASKTEKITSSTNVVTSYVWNAGNKYVLQSATVDPTGLALTTGFSFDAIGNLTAVDAPRTDVTDVANYTWDGNRRLRFSIQPDPDGAGPLKRSATLVTYDLDGQVIQVDIGKTTTVNGSDFVVLQTSTSAYDAARQMAKQVTPAGVTQFNYDGAGRQVCAAQRMNPAVYASLPTDACALGTAGTNGPDRIVKTSYDLAGQTTTVVQAYGTADQRTYAAYSYSDNGQQTKVVDARGNPTQMEYDGFDRLVKMRFPTQTVGAAAASTTDYEAYSYDQAGNRLTVRRRDGQIIESCYDPLGRVTRRYMRDVAGCTTTGQADDVFIAYNLKGEVLSTRFQSAGGQGVTASYDKAGRQLTESTFGKAVGFQYDKAGNRTRILWPVVSGTTSFYVHYDYDAVGRVTQLRQQGLTTGQNLLAAYGYDDLGRRVSVTRPNGTETSYSYDAASRLTGLGQDLTGTTHDQTFTFAYSPASQILGRTTSNDLYNWTPPAPSVTANTYTGLNQDSAIVALGSDCTQATSGYDCRGNLKNDGTRTFAYDIENRLTSVTGPTSMTLSYDPLGRLSQTVSGATATLYVYEGSDLLATYDGSGALLQRYVHGPGTDEPVAWYSGTAVTGATWLHQDWQGSIIAESDATGAVTQLHSYGPWGEPDDWGAGSPFRYTGQIALNGVELYHYKARVYDPAMGRFLQTDPIGYADDLNLYGYVRNDPINLIDPTGTDSCETVGENGEPGPRIPDCIGDPNGPSTPKAEADAVVSEVEVVARKIKDRKSRSGAGLRKGIWEKKGELVFKLVDGVLESIPAIKVCSKATYDVFKSPNGFITGNESSTGHTHNANQGTGLGPHDAAAALDHPSGIQLQADRSGVRALAKLSTGSAIAVSSNGRWGDTGTRGTRAIVLDLAASRSGTTQGGIGAASKATC